MTTPKLLEKKLEEVAQNVQKESNLEEEKEMCKDKEWKSETDYGHTVHPLHRPAFSTCLSSLT